MTTEQNVENWNRVGMLEGVSDNLVESLALCLQTQVDYNNRDYDFPSNFLLLSIPIVRRLFSESKVVKQNNLFDGSNNTSSKEFVFKTKFNPPVDNLDYIASYNEAFCKDIAIEIDEEFKDSEQIKFEGFNTLDDGTFVMNYSS